MTTETKPATDEEIAQFLAAMEGDEPESEDAIIRALIARIDAERERADEAEDRVEELERDSERVAAEFEGDATKTLGKLAAEFDDTFHEWADREGGWTVDSAAQSIYDGRADLVRRNDALAAQLAEARQQIAALRGALREVTRAEASNAHRLRGAIVEARQRLKKGRALWNGPCHECDAVLAQALSANNDAEAIARAVLTQTEGAEG